MDQLVVRDAVIRVYVAAGNVIETRGHKGDCCTRVRLPGEPLAKI